MKKAVLILCSILFATGMNGDCSGDMGMPAAEELPQGACCVLDGSCVTTDSAGCVAVNGVFNEGILCLGVLCPQPGACCAPNGVCRLALQADCIASGSEFRGGQCEDLICTGFLNGEWRYAGQPGIGCLTILDGKIVAIDDACNGVPTPFSSPEPITIGGTRIVMAAIVELSGGVIVGVTWELDLLPDGSFVGTVTFIEGGGTPNVLVDVVMNRR